MAQRRYEIRQVDAFTTRPLEGNPCVVVFDAGAMDDETMQRVAREMNLSETAFVIPSEVADFGVRYFTPSEEVPLAGHPTIATAWALAETGRMPLGHEGADVTFELRVGPIRVQVEAEGGKPLRVVMTQKKPELMATYEPGEVLPVFGLEPGDLLPGKPIQTVSTGTPQLMIPLAGHDALRRVRPDPAALADLRARSDFFSVHLFALGGATPEGATFARHFASPPDLFEDPFTGSATGGMTAYLWHHGIMDAPTWVAEQGHWMGRPGRARVEVEGPREAPETVRVAGPAATVLVGELVLP